jgi:hypothetical protein
LALAIDRLCPYFYSLRLPQAQSRYIESQDGGEGKCEVHPEVTAVENPFRFLQCFLAMNNEGRARRLVMPGMPLEGIFSMEARRCAEVLEEAGISGIAIIGRDDLHRKTYHLQGGSRDPGVAHYYEIPDFWFGEDKEPLRRGFHHVLRIAFHATRSTATEEAPELHKYYNRRTSSILPSPFERRIGVLYCPDGELTFGILHWRLLLFANACSTACKDPAIFQEQLRRLRIEILAAIDRSDIGDGMLWPALHRIQTPLGEMACQADLKVLNLLVEELRLENLDLPKGVGLPFPLAQESEATPAAFWSLRQELFTQFLCDKDGVPTERFLGLQAWLRGLRARTLDDSLFPEGWPLHPDLLGNTTAKVDGEALASVAKELCEALEYWEAVSKREEADGEGCLHLLMSGFRFPHLPYYLWRSKGAFALGHLAFPVAHSHMSMPDDIFVNNLATGAATRDEKGGAIGYFAAGFREDHMRSQLLSASSVPGTDSSYFYYNKEELTRKIRTARLLGEALGAELAAVNFSQGFLAEEFRARHSEREAFVETTMHYLSKRLDPLTRRLPEAARDLLIDAGRFSRKEFFELYERGAELTIEGMVLERLIAGMRNLDKEVTRNQWLNVTEVASKLDLFFSDLSAYIGGDFHLCHWASSKVKHARSKIPVYAIYRILYVMARNYEDYFKVHHDDPIFCRRLAIETTCTVCGDTKKGGEISIDFDAAEEALVLRQKNPFVESEQDDLEDRIGKGTGIRLDIVRVARSRRLFRKAEIAGPRINAGFFEMEVKLWL